MKEHKYLLGSCFMGILLMYLGIQSHESFHWGIARLLNVGALVGPYTISYTNVPDWKSILIGAGGTINTIALELLGFALFRTQRETWKRLGLDLLFVTATSRILYEFSGVVIQAQTDESGFAALLRVPDWPLRIAVSAFGILLLGYLIKTKELNASLKWKLVTSFIGVIIAILLVLLFGKIFDLQSQLGKHLFQPVFYGFSPMLILLDGVMLVFLIYLLWRQENFSVVASTLFSLLIAAISGWQVLQPAPERSCGPAPQTIRITPGNGSIQKLNEFGQQVIIQFDRPMAMGAGGPNITSIVYDDNLGPIEPVMNWDAPERLVIKFGRTIIPGETIKLGFMDIRDASGKEICSPVYLLFE